MFYPILKCKDLKLIENIHFINLLILISQQFIYLNTYKTKYIYIYIYIYNSALH